MLEHEQRGLPYLFKLSHTAKVKELVTRMMRHGALWQDCGDDWQALETTIRLSGWTQERRVVLVRENPAKAPVREPGKPRRGKPRQKLLPNAKGTGWDAQATPRRGKIAVLVTSLDEQAFPTQVIPKHYRDRADAENCFDELKNQWGWNGYTSRKLASSRLMANLVALIYNWWNLYLRFYDEEHHREAIRTRPMLSPEWDVRSKAAAVAPSKSASCTKKATTSPEPSPRSATSCITSAPSRSDGAWTNAGRCC
jgi:Transposase DDE domain